MAWRFHVFCSTGNPYRCVTDIFCDPVSLKRTRFRTKLKLCTVWYRIFYTHVILIDSKCKNTMYVFWYYFFSKTQSQLDPLSANDPFKPWVTNSEWRRTDEYHRTMLLSLIRPDHDFCTWTWWICPARLLSGHAGAPFTNSLVLEKLS